MTPLPAQPEKIKSPDSVIRYMQDGKLHRLDGPAVIHPDGTEEWYKNGQRHRDDGPAYRDPGKTFMQWYRDGVLHRDGGPAVVNGASRFWYRNGLLHREDGPAEETIDGVKYWLDGCEYMEGAKGLARAFADRMKKDGLKTATPLPCRKFTPKKNGGPKPPR